LGGISALGEEEGGKEIERERTLSGLSLSLSFPFTSLASLSSASAPSEDLSAIVVVVVVVVVVVEISSFTRQTSSRVKLASANHGAFYRVSRGTIFAPFNFDYESSRVTRVSVRDGGLRAAAIAAGDLRHSPLRTVSP